MVLLRDPCDAALNLFGAAGDFNQMEPELGLHRAVDFADGFAEDYLVEFLDHLAPGKCAQIAPLLTGRTLRVLLGQGGEIRSGFNLLLDVFAFFLRANQDMTRGGFSHGNLRLF